MDYFNKYVSNTLAGSGNQLYFSLPACQIQTGRIFYKIFASGTYNYSLLFSNIIDSTYSNGSVSRKNLICESWTIHSAKIGKCKKFNTTKDISLLTMSEQENADIIITDFHNILFKGEASKTVMPGEFFSSDPVELNFDSGDYLCLEMTFLGTMIPYHEETLLPVFIKKNDIWEYSRLMPVPGMIGCDRKVKARVGYLGDSITQGIGPENNSYLHWSALLSEMIGQEYAFWNLGIGFGRANDLASDSAWMYKARHNDIVFVCYGVNDLTQNIPEEQIKADLEYIVDTLKKRNIKIILQTIPPFDYLREDISKWERINRYIKEDLANIVEAVFDTVPYLCESLDQSYKAKYQGHPNAEGSAIWANALYQQIQHLL